MRLLPLKKLPRLYRRSRRSSNPGPRGRNVVIRDGDAHDHAQGLHAACGTVRDVWPAKRDDTAPEAVTASVRHLRTPRIDVARRPPG
ncbi:hypothetical protein [Stenotrophomonas sp.]|uniref:hypothetical protein n=1 Tax=Stenotrophomonas sp. TaxID=69392 RepID=UPI0028B04A52|nr:hypothetical protein [Stenotrophomonas sp.]